ncbi:MAG: DsbA family protein [Alphaproteobacteria bacterium]|nr:DsbA family protein [Alphaproteobacteria bacterium]
MSKQPEFQTSLTRRHVLAVTAAAAAAAGLGLGLAAQPAVAVEQAKLMADTGLPELAIGPADAKVTVVEYASMTCPHCARFHNDIYPQIKEKYIDSGKVRFIFREFPLDNLAAAASMLARCSGEGKTLPMISVLFSKMEDWAFVRDKPVPALFEIAKQAGFTKESFETCLKDQPLLDKILAQRKKASEEFGVTSTPTFFINGEKLDGGPTLEALSKAIDPLLAEG